jgi:tRNA pseudouridine38-40 synthase
MHPQRVQCGVRVKAVIAYDGTDYHGFQRQAIGREPTIQGALERALIAIGQAGAVTGAGRTDAGVHASGQVVAFDVQWRHSLDDLQRALNAVLPDSIAVPELEQAADDFHPRYDAVSREYRYRLYQGRVRDPLKQRFALHVPHALDVGVMQAASQALIGEHDFAAFGRPTIGESTTRSMYRADVRVAEDQIAIELQANGFLYHMVRRIAGTLIAVGRGERSAAEFANILHAADPSRAAAVIAPNGLCLTKVNY